MEEQRKPCGRGKIIELLKQHVQRPQGTASEGGSVGDQLSERETSDSSSTSVRSGLGRGDFLAKLRSQPKMKVIDCSVSQASECDSSSVSSQGSSGTRTVKTITSSMKNIQIRDDDSSSETKAPVKRGEFGEKINVSTNFVYLRSNPNRTVFEYEVKFSPDVDYVSYRYRILYEQFTGKKDILCYDGSAKLFTPERITDSCANFKSKHPITGDAVVMSIRYVRLARMKDCAVLYNTLFKNCARVLSFTRFKNKFYDHRSTLKIPQHKLEIWPGFVTSVEEFDGGVQLRCDIHHRILRTDTPYDILSGLVKRDPSNVKALAERELLGECVITRYNNNIYRIDDIDWTKSPLSTFKLSNGQELSFIEYYKRQYNLDITDVKQPLLINRAKNEKGQKSRLVCLVPELCCMTGLTDKMRSDVKIMKDIAMYTRVTPAQRVCAFKQFLRNIQTSKEAQEMLLRWGLSIAEEPVTLDARNLGAEALLFGNNKTYSSGGGNWQRCFGDVTVFHSVDLLSWIIVFPSKSSPTANAFTSTMRKLGPGLGIEIAEPMKVNLTDDRIETYIRALRKSITPETQIVVCLCPSARDDRYSAIKKFCCKEIPIPSQVVNCITLSRQDRMRSVVQNIALQINNKLGGASWAIRIPFRNTMICGVDTYHDKIQKSSCVGGFVASVNSDYTEWFSRTNFQGPKQELIEGLINSFIAALKYYLRKNYSLPERIIVYRDGLSDGLFETCCEFEIAQFLEACRIVSSDYQPKFSLVIVQKRIATKFYELTGNRTEPKNPRPGGVVDNTITKKNYYDFFLVSQSVREGTATPTHYIVLYDNSDLKPDQIQRLTYKFCHLYYNYSGTVRVPAPCGYAHKLAYLVGQHVKAMPDERLENKLYYL